MHRTRTALLALLTVVLLTLGACDDDAPTSGATDTGDGAAARDGDAHFAGTELRLVTHDSFNVSEEVLAAFTDDTGIEVRIVKSGDAGTMLNQAILTKDNPLGDVLFGVDNTFLSRALGEDLFVPYEAENLDRVPERYRLDPEHRVTPIDHGEVCINYDKAAFDGAGTPPPASLEDLTDPRYKGQLVVENPATSSPGLAFLLATIERFGGDGWRDFWAELKANDVLVSPGWEEAYYGQFSGGSGEGTRPLVVSYATSPPAEVVFAEEPPAEAPTGVLTDSCFEQIEFAGILRGTEHEDAAARLVDFLLSEPFQEDVPLQMFVFPVLEGADLPEAFTEHAAIVDDPIRMEPTRIGEHRERWIDEWTETVLG